MARKQNTFPIDGSRVSASQIIFHSYQPHERYRQIHFTYRNRFGEWTEATLNGSAAFHLRLFLGNNDPALERMFCELEAKPRVAQLELELELNI